MSNWANAIHASDLPGAIDPLPDQICAECGEEIPAWLAGSRCDRCARLDRYAQEFQAALASRDDPRR